MRLACFHATGGFCKLRSALDVDQGISAGGRQGVLIGNRVAGPTGNPGGGNREGNRFGDYDTGNTRISGQTVAPNKAPTRPIPSGRLTRD